MHFDNPLEVPLRDRPERSSAGITGPSQIPADDDDPALDVSDAVIIELEDGFSFLRGTPSHGDESPERVEVFGNDAFVDRATTESNRTFLERHWLVNQGEG